MSSTDQNTPAGKPGRRNRKAERSQKPGRQQSPKPDQPQHAKEQIDATAAPADAAPIARPRGGHRSRSAFRPSRMPTATTPGNRSKRPGPLSRSSQACGRSTRSWRFRPNSRSRLTRPSWPSRRRFANSTASLPGRPSSRCKASRPRRPKTRTKTRRLLREANGCRGAGYVWRGEAPVFRSLFFSNGSAITRGFRSTSAGSSLASAAPLPFQRDWRVTKPPQPPQEARATSTSASAAGPLRRGAGCFTRKS